MTTLAQALRRDATVVTFNMSKDQSKLNEDQALPQEVVVELDDMTDEQKRIVRAGETIAGSFPQGQSKEARIAWMMQQFLTK